MCAKWTVFSRAMCCLQVHFEGGTVAQIVYSEDQQDRGQQQVVYTADGNSYTSVESAEHTLVYIHPADGSQVRNREHSRTRQHGIEDFIFIELFLQSNIGHLLSIVALILFVYFLLSDSVCRPTTSGLHTAGRHNTTGK